MGINEKEARREAESRKKGILEALQKTDQVEFNQVVHVSPGHEAGRGEDQVRSPHEQEANVEAILNTLRGPGHSGCSP